MIAYSSSTSRSLRAAVGSSIEITCASNDSAFTISTICCSATVSEPTRDCGSMKETPRSPSSSPVRTFMARTSMSPARRGSRPR